VIEMDNLNHGLRSRANSVSPKPRKHAQLGDSDTLLDGNQNPFDTIDEAGDDYKLPTDDVDLLLDGIVPKTDVVSMPRWL
jgi:hypothetical protein